MYLPVTVNCRWPRLSRHRHAMRWVFAKYLKCKCSVSNGFVVLCRWKPVLISPYKHRAERPQPPTPSLTVVFAAMRVNQLNFYISIVLPTPCSYSVSAGGQIAVSAKPNIHGLYPDCEMMWACACVRACLVYVWVCMKCLSIVCAAGS